MKISKKQMVLISSIASALLLIYICSYFMSTEMFYGQFGEDIIDIRLFKSKSHYAIYWPCVQIEEIMKTDRKSDYRFYGQVHSGASLPPERDVVK